MKKLNIVRNLCATAAFGMALSNPAWAGPKLFAYLNNSITFNGTTETTVNGNVDPFNVELFSAGNECLRILVTAQGTDLEATLVAPDGRTWQDDDSGGSLRPFIKAITTTRGWHILRLSSFSGAAVNADFTVLVSRLPSTSTLCAPATGVAVPFALAAPKPAAAAAARPAPGGTQ
jgi:hypothetical protein